jgi:hypothetical protein
MFKELFSTKTEVKQGMRLGDWRRYLSGFL